MVLDASVPWAMPSMRVAPQSVAAHEHLGHRGREQVAFPALEKPEGIAAGSRRDIHGVEVGKLVESLDLRSVAEFHLDGGELQGYVGVELGEAGMRAESAAPAVFLFEHRDLEFLLGEIQRAGKAGDARADDGDALVLGRYDVGLRLAVLRVSKAGGFEIAQGDRLVAEQRALAVVSAGLIAERADDGGKDGGVAQNLVGCHPSALARLLQEGADVHVERTRVGT